MPGLRQHPDYFWTLATLRERKVREVFAARARQRRMELRQSLDFQRPTSRRLRSDSFQQSRGRFRRPIHATFQALEEQALVLPAESSGFGGRGGRDHYPRLELGAVEAA